MDPKERLKQLEVEMNDKGGPLVKAKKKNEQQKVTWVVPIVLAVASILLLANQVDSQQREQWGFGLLGFGAGLAVGDIKRGRD